MRELRSPVVVGRAGRNPAVRPLVLLLVVGCVLFGCSKALRAQPDGSGQAEAPEGSGAPAEESEGDAAVRRALELFDAGRSEAADQVILGFASAQPGPTLIPVRYTRELGMRVEFDHAISFLGRHLEGQPSDTVAALEIGVLLQRLLRFEEAAVYLELINDETAASMTARLGRLNRGLGYRALGRWDQARAVYSELLTGATRPFAENALCGLELSLGDLAGCRARLERIADDLGEHSATLDSHALLAYLEGDVEAARTNLDARLTQAGRGARMTTLDVRLCLATGDYERADDLLSSIREISVRGERSLLQAVSFSLQGDHTAAMSAFGQAVERTATFSDAALTGQILLWNEALIATLAQLIVDVQAQQPPPLSGAAAETSNAAQGHGQTATQSGCCAVSGGNLSDSRSTGIGVAILGLLGFCRSRRGERPR